VTLQLVAVAFACLGVGAVVQAALGFGMGVVAIPLLVWGGFSLPEAIGALVPNVLFQTGLGCWRQRRELPWRDVLPMTAIRYATLPAGVWTLGILAEQGQAATRMVLGVGLVFVLAVQQGRPSPGGTRRPGTLATLLSGTTSGFLAGVIGMGGPTLVLWVMRQDWESRRQRTFLWLSFLLLMPAQIGLMSWRFGQPWLDAMLIGGCVVPLTLCLAWFAQSWADRWSRARLRTAMRLFLLFIALRLIWQVVRPWTPFA
jgi:uncharacterized protein